MVAAFYALPVRASDPRTNIVRQRVPVRAGPPLGGVYTLDATGPCTEMVLQGRRVMQRIHEAEIFDLRGLLGFLPVAHRAQPFAHLVGEHEFEFRLTPPRFQNGERFAVQRQHPIRKQGTANTARTRTSATQAKKPKNQFLRAKSTTSPPSSPIRTTPWATPRRYP
jgi:hypothetical protein